MPWPAVMHLRSASRVRTRRPDRLRNPFKMTRCAPRTPGPRRAAALSARTSTGPRSGPGWRQGWSLAREPRPLRMTQSEARGFQFSRTRAGGGRDGVFAQAVLSARLCKATAVRPRGRPVRRRPARHQTVESGCVTKPLGFRAVFYRRLRTRATVLDGHRRRCPRHLDTASNRSIEYAFFEISRRSR